MEMIIFKSLWYSFYNNNNYFQIIVVFVI